MRILALVTEAFGGFGGIARSNKDLLEALAASEKVNEVIILPRKAENKGAIFPKKVKQLSARQGKMVYGLKAARALSFSKDFRFIFCGHLFMAPLAALLSFFSGLPFWLHIHGIEVWRRPGFFVRKASEKAGLVTAVSRFTREKFLGWADVEPSRVRVLPDTVDEKFFPGPKSEALLGRYGLRGNRILLTVGRLEVSERYKGHERVLSALSSLLIKHPDLVYVIAGNGNDRMRLEKVAEALGLGSAVRFIGRVSDEELPDLYRMADVFVMPSTGEGFGIVFLEAMACGVPVVGTRLDGSVDPLQNGRLGALCDEASLERVLEQALTNKEGGGPELFKKVNGSFGKTVYGKQVLNLADSMFLKS